MKKGTEIKQHDITDCGATCIASVAAYHGLGMPIAKIRQMASTDKQGTNALGLIEAAEKLGFSAKGVKSVNPDGSVKLEPLYKIPKPAIAHMVVKENLLHYVVIYGIDKNHVSVMDPIVGKVNKIKIEEFAKEWTGVLILLLPDDGFQKGKFKISIFQRFLFLLKPHRKVLLQALVGALIYTILGLATSIYLQKIIDYVIPDANKNLLNLLSICMVAILFISLFINHVKTRLMFHVGMKMDVRLILGYYKHLLKLPQTFFDSMRTGEIISRVNDAVKIRIFINETLVSLMVNIFTVIFAFVLMFTYYWKLAVVILTIIPLYFIIYLIYNRVNKVTQRKIMENAAELEAQLVESINVVGTIKRFGIEEYANIKTESRFITFIRTSYRSAMNSLWASNGVDGIARLFVIILLWGGTYFVLDNIITPGELLSFYALIGYFIDPIGSLVDVNVLFQDAKIAADRLFEIIDLDQEDDQQKMKLSREQCGDISFENVSFSYGSRTDVFKQFSIHFEKGRVNALVGESGSGKTTIASLLQNLYPISEGRITIGGIDIKHINNEDLRSLIGIVPQDVELFGGSIIDNIALDDMNPEWEKVLQLCKDVGIIEFIEKLPMGFNTNIGENGAQLSGGQRQRIAIVRALYRDPEIIILDEATSALDSESEQSVKEVIRQLRERGKSILLIAHRLGTVMTADKIFVLKEGKLVESGSHQELIAFNGNYAKYWDSQTNILQDK